jgi:hypothetical protein
LQALSHGRQDVLRVFFDVVRRRISAYIRDFCCLIYAGIVHLLHLFRWFGGCALGSVRDGHGLFHGFAAFNLGADVLLERFV